MGKRKRRGHYCKVCGGIRPNERFSGKGHRQHICKDCKRKKRKSNPPPTIEDKQEEEIDYNEGKNFDEPITNGMILIAKRSDFFLFEFQYRLYTTRDDFESEVFMYQDDPEEKFIVEEFMQMDQRFSYFLYGQCMTADELGYIFDYRDIENGDLEILENKRQYLAVIKAMNYLE